MNSITSPDHIPGGCIMVARKMLDSDLMDQSPLVVKLWVWLLLKANWRDRPQLERGQLVTTIAEMQKAMSHYSGWRKFTPTPDQIRSAYGTLRDTARITARRTTRGMVITVTNYSSYQDIDAYASRTASHGGSATCPAATPHDTEEVNKRKNAYSDFFESLWKTYPAKDGKKRAMVHFQATVKSDEDCKRIKTALDNYLAHLEVETWKKPKNGVTWFGNWQDWETWTPPATQTDDALFKGVR